jgi:endonuclease YncB( thermonuclease family)
MSLLIDATDDVPSFTLAGKRLAKVVSCYDGDTFEAVIELGGQLWKFDCRMNAYDAPEIKPLKTMLNREAEKQAAVRSKTALLSFVCDGVDATKSYTNKELNAIVKLNKRIIELECKGFDKYGRVLVEIPLASTIGLGAVNNWMIENNYGYAYSGGTRKAWEAGK